MVSADDLEIDAEPLNLPLGQSLEVGIVGALPDEAVPHRARRGTQAFGVRGQPGCGRSGCRDSTLDMSNSEGGDDRSNEGDGFALTVVGLGG